MHSNNWIGDNILGKSRKWFTGSGELSKAFDLQVVFIVQLRMRFLYKPHACNAVLIQVLGAAQPQQYRVGREMSKRVSAALEQ